MKNPSGTTEWAGEQPRVVLWLAVTAGILGDLLFRVEPWGINFLVFGAVVTGIILVLERMHRLALPGTSRNLLLLAVLCLSSFTLRDSPALNLLSLASAFTALSLAAYRAQGGALNIAGTIDYAGALIRNWLSIWFGALPLALHDISWQRSERTSRWASIGRGLLLALPVVIIFAALFASADPIFGSLFAFDMKTVVSHSAVIGGVLWLSAGYGRALLLGRPIVSLSVPHGARDRWGFIETTVLLGAVNAIFLAFVVVQIRTLFGGDAFVLSQTGLTYAEYARRGFFDLVLVSALVLPLLLVVEWNGRRSNPRQETAFRALSYLLLLLLSVVLMSAMQRMRIYQLSYGLTEQRVYTMAFMLWLALVFIWLAATVLRGRRERFASGAAVLALVILVGLHFVNPDNLIVRTNLARASRGSDFDADYAAELSDDAVPALVEALPGLAQDAHCRVLGHFAVRQKSRHEPDWRAFNFSRQRATRLIAAELARAPAEAASCETLVRAGAHED